ncbi:MAG TPA: hypothetical protein VID07_10075 [Actinomycetes bacterium]
MAAGGAAGGCAAVGTWALLVLLARRLPPGLLNDLARFILVPEILPVIGPLDDVVVVALALRYAARQVPGEVLVAAWPGQPRLLHRLLGGPAPLGPRAQ